MRYLKKEGYRVVSLQAFIEFMSFKRQLPRKSVVLSFDDGYRSFNQRLRARGAQVRRLACWRRSRRS
jgi:peptidoglycan/xylan/chitin deacetylase (PgdA/CDA1 family)